jgi:hypothetical protein
MRKRHFIFKLLGILLSQVLLIIIVTKTHLVYTNTLKTNSNWLVTKNSLEMTVMGSPNFFKDRQALAYERLNLGAWHGFQEVVYKDRIDLNAISFDFYLSDNSYLYFIFNKTDNSFSAIRLSNHEDFESMFIRSLDSGEFLSSKPIFIESLNRNNWNKILVVFDKQNQLINIKLNGQKIEVRGKILNSQYVGFRGSLNEVLVDNIIFRGNDDELLLSECFSNNKNWYVYAIKTLIFVVGFNIVIGLFFQRFKIKQKHILFIISYINIVTTILVFVVGLWLYLTSNNYPKVDSLWNNLAKKEDNFAISLMERKNDYIMSRYPKMPLDDTLRIMMIGSSQTRGSGAKYENDKFSVIVENILNRKEDVRYFAGIEPLSRVLGLVKTRGEGEHTSMDLQEQIFEIINVGTRHSNSSELLEYYKNYWISLSPKIVVINLSFNDSDPAIFEKNLIEFVRVNNERGIITVFLLEANSFENEPDASRNHLVMINVAEKYNVSVFDLHGYLITQKDKGILWWDMVHPTSFGHKLIAMYLVKIIEGLL